MPRLKPGDPGQDPIEQDFLDALERLQASAPKNKKLKQRAAEGVLKINISTVAMESGRSRTLIALEEDCRYPRARALIVAAKDERTSVPRTYTELVDRLRADKADLALQVKAFQAEARVQFSSRVKAEKELAQAQAERSRLRKLLAESGKVVALVPQTKGESK